MKNRYSQKKLYSYLGLFSENYELIFVRFLNLISMTVSKSAIILFQFDFLLILKSISNSYFFLIENHRLFRE